MILTLYIIGAVITFFLLGYSLAGIPKNEFDVFTVYGLIIVVFILILWPIFIGWCLIDVIWSSDDDVQ